MTLQPAQSASIALVCADTAGGGIGGWLCGGKNWRVVLRRGGGGGGGSEVGYWVFVGDWDISLEGLKKGIKTNGSGGTTRGRVQENMEVSEAREMFYNRDTARCVTCDV